MRSGRLWAAMMVLTALWPRSAQAQDEDPKLKYVPTAPEAAKKLSQTWDGKLNVGASFALAQNKNVVGRDTGVSVALGAKVDGELIAVKGGHSWKNTLNVGLTFTYTPVASAFVKTNDLLTFDTKYQYQLEKYKLGPFMQIQLEMPLFAGRDVRGEIRDYSIKMGDGSTRTQRSDSLRLSDPFAPITIKQTGGFFAKPLSKTGINLEFKAGFQARQTFAAGQLNIDDNTSTDEIEGKELEDVYQGGPSVGLEITGELFKGKLTYGTVFEAMFPVLRNAPKDPKDEKPLSELTNVNIGAKLKLKLAEWASIDYVFRALREPQVIAKWQIQNNLLLTFSHALVKSSAKEE